MNDRTYVTWDNNPKGNNLEDGAIVLECLEFELLGDHATKMPLPSTKRFPDAITLPLASQPPSLYGSCVVFGSVP